MYIVCIITFEYIYTFLCVCTRTKQIICNRNNKLARLLMLRDIVIYKGIVDNDDSCLQWNLYLTDNNNHSYTFAFFAFVCILKMYNIQSCRVTFDCFSDILPRAHAGMSLNVWHIVVINLIMLFKYTLSLTIVDFFIGHCYTNMLHKNVWHIVGSVF